MGFKYKVLGLVRKLNLLKQADNFKFFLKKFSLASRNREFIKNNPDFPVPPVDLAFDAYNMFDWEEYKKGGVRHAKIFTDVINEHLNAENLKILEWGCGPGRLIRHMPDLIAGNPEIHGSDYNPKTIEWCQQNLKGIHFVKNEIKPPLPFDDNSFDAVYNFSVFTHLTEESQIEWAGELRRVLKPEGIFICTTHGDHFKKLLNAKEQSDYDAGRLVIQDNYSEGKKWFFAIHPPGFVKDILLKDFKDLTPIKVGPEADTYHDIWLGKK